MAVHVHLYILYVAIMTVKLSVKPTLDEIKAEYKERGKTFSNLTPAHKKVAIFLDQWVQNNFKDEGKGLGTDRWKALKAGGRYTSGVFDTAAKLLQDSGRLKFSFLPFATQRDAGIGSKLAYSKNHNNGIGVPMRRILPLALEVKDRIDEILTEHGRKSLGIKS